MSAIFSGSAGDVPISAGSPAILDDVFSGGLGGTLMAWIKANDEGQNSAGRIFNKATSNVPVNAWFFATVSTAALQFRYSYATTDMIRTTSNSALTFGAWHHVAVSYDAGDILAINCKMYIDGVQATYQTSQNGSSTADSDATANFLIGDDANQTRAFSGSIAECEVYNKILTNVQIIAAMRGICPTPASRIGYWPLYSNLSTVLTTDFSGRNNHTNAVGVPGFHDVPERGLFLNGKTSRISREVIGGIYYPTGVGTKQETASPTSPYIRRHTIISGY